MIGAFARMFGENSRVTEVADAPEGGMEVRARGDGVETRLVADDAPPSAFVEKIEHEGGDVYIVPFVEAFRAWLRKRRDP